MQRLIGYVRTTRDSSDLDTQFKALLAAGVEKDNIYIEKTSGFHAKREEFIIVQSELKNGDLLIIHRLEIIGKSVKNLLEILNNLLDKNCNIKTLSGSPSIDTRYIEAKLLIEFISSIVSYDKEMNREKTRIGLSNAKDRGQKLGRKKTLNSDDIDYIKLWKNKKSAKEIYEARNIPKSTYYRYLKEINVEENKEL